MYLRLPQWKVAERAGVTQQAYCRYEARETEPRVNDAHRIARVLGIGGEPERIAESFGDENGNSARSIDRTRKRR
jgi:transcriptional regulator with XRE-family HTH domain